MWQCVKCREKLEDSFDVCWSCGTSKDGVEDPDFRKADDLTPEQEAIAESQRMLARARWDQLRLIAVRQRRLIIGIGLCVFAYCFAYVRIGVLATAANPDTHPGAQTLASCMDVTLTLILVAVQVWLVVGVAKALDLGDIWLWGIGACLPLIGLVVLLVINQKATGALKAAGVEVWLFGTKLPKRPPA